MKISQREARRLRMRVAALEADRDYQRRSWVRDYPGGTSIDTVLVSREAWFVVQTARKLGHAVVVTCGPVPELRVHGLRLPR